MKVLLGLIGLGFCLESILVEGAGRALPVASENYVTRLFKSVNNYLEYDGSNFLVDLSGNFASCNFARTRRLSIVDDITPEGSSIGLIQDFTRGDQTHVNAVVGYLEPVFDSWVEVGSDFWRQIRAAEKFGCSVRPGCGGFVSVACLFSPAINGNPATPPHHIVTKSTASPTTRRRPPPPTLPTRLPPVYPQKGEAFTGKQYDKAEKMTQQKWDRSHFLENLSGIETRCGMMFEKDHKFIKAIDEARDRGKDVTGLYGVEPNTGSTDKALDRILEDMSLEAQSDSLLSGFFTGVQQEKKGKKVGCSLISDCVHPFTKEMFVVVSCIFELGDI